MGTEVPEQFLGKMTESKETNGAIDNGGDGERKESLDQEGPKQHLSPGWGLVKDDTNTR